MKKWLKAALFRINLKKLFALDPAWSIFLNADLIYLSYLILALVHVTIPIFWWIEHSIKDIPLAIASDAIAYLRHFCNSCMYFLVCCLSIRSLNRLGQDSYSEDFGRTWLFFVVHVKLLQRSLIPIGTIINTPTFFIQSSIFTPTYAQ